VKALISIAFEHKNAVAYELADLLIIELYSGFCLGLFVHANTLNHH
jgi:hypothetical protein